MLIDGELMDTTNILLANSTKMPSLQNTHTHTHTHTHKEKKNLGCYNISPSKYLVPLTLFFTAKLFLMLN